MRKTPYLPELDPDIQVRKSICTICDPNSQCGLDLYIKDGQIVKVEGDKNQPYGQGTLCVKGAALRQYVYNEDRVKTPLKRTGPRGSGQYTPITWEEAYEEIATKLGVYKDAGTPEQVLFFSGYAKFFRPWLKRLAHSYGTPNYTSESSSCAQAMNLSQALVFGTSGGPHVGGGLECLLVWSNNPFASNPGGARGINNMVKKGVKLIVVDPRNTPSALKADIHLQVRPGTDGALALAMGHVIIAENLCDMDYVAKYTHGFEEYKTYVQEFTPERGEELTGVPAQKIIEAARMFATAKASGIQPSAAPVVHNTNGVQNYRAIFSLLGLTGNFDVPGGQTVNPPSFFHLPGQFPTRQDEFMQSRPYEEMAPIIGANLFPVWTEIITDEGQAMYLPEQIRTANPYPIKAVVAFGMNHRMWSDSKAMAAALEQLDFFVDVELFMTDTAKLADIILPACSSVERSEFRCWPNGYVVYTTPAIPPLYESRNDIDIICQMATYIAPEDTLLGSGIEASLDWLLQPSGLTVEQMKPHTGGMFIPNPQPAPIGKYLENGFNTPSGKIEFYSEVLKKHGIDPLPVYKAPLHSQVPTPEVVKEYPMILNTGSRLPMFIHTRTYRLAWSASLRKAPAIDIHPEDGAALGLSQGDLVKVVSPMDEVRGEVNLTFLAQKGVVHLYHGYREGDANSLIPWDYRDPISGYPGYKGYICRLERVEEG